MTDPKSFIACDPPERIKFTLSDPQQEQRVILKITNKSEMKQAFKVKCTRNDLFRIRPAMGILDYNQTFAITLIYRGGQTTIQAEDRHHFGVYNIPAPEGCTCEGAWAEHYGPPQGEHKLRMVFAELRKTGRAVTRLKQLIHGFDGDLDNGFMSLNRR